MSNDSVANNIGDSFLNQCFEKNSFFHDFSHTRDAVFGWAESYPLLILILVLLIILPSLFTHQKSLLKVSRIYNATRLGMMSLLHEVCFSYSIGGPLRMIVFQPSPCIHSVTFGQFNRLLNFPASVILGGSSFAFGVSYFIGWHSFIAKLLVTACLMVYVIAGIGTNESTFVQGTAAVGIGYILHFINLYVPFKYVHVENAVLAFVGLGGFFAVRAHGWPWSLAFSENWFVWVVILIDELMLWRHHSTRKGFRTIERPADISWVMEEGHVESIRLLNSEEEADLPKNCQSDLVTSVLAFVGVFAGVLIRTILQPVFFPTAS
jgi:hypothetical protein